MSQVQDRRARAVLMRGQPAPADWDPPSEEEQRAMASESLQARAAAHRQTWWHAPLWFVLGSAVTLVILL